MSGFKITFHVGEIELSRSIKFFSGIFDPKCIRKKERIANE